MLFNRYIQPQGPKEMNTKHSEKSYVQDGKGFFCKFPVRKLFFGKSPPLEVFQDTNRADLDCLFPQSGQATGSDLRGQRSIGEGVPEVED